MTFYFPLPEKVIKSKIIYDCKKCGLKKKSKFPPIEASIGKQYDGLVIVGHNPSIIDAKSNNPLTDDKTVIIRSTFFRNKVNLATQSAITYGTICQTKKPTDTQFKCCRPILAKTLSDLKPKVIVTLGSTAFKMVMNLKNKETITAIRNRVIPNYEFNCIVFPIMDPNESFSYHYKFAIEKDIERICTLWKNNYRKRTYINSLLKKRKILDNIEIKEIKPNEVDKTFKQILQLKEVSLDYEATSLKPHDLWFEITHIQFGIENIAWVFHESIWENDLDLWEKIKKYMIQILTDKSILKTIHNSKFEDLASRYVFGIDKIENMFCTMVATHVIDERGKTKSLDFQNLVRFGIPPYSETVKPFLESKNKNDKINNIRNAPHDDLILYAGLDVITCFNQYLILKNELLPNAYDKAIDNYNFLMEGHWVFANLSQRGAYIGEKEFSEFENLLDKKIQETLKNIEEIPEFQEFNEYMRTKDKSPKKGDKELEQLIKLTKEKERKEHGNRKSGRKIPVK